MKVEHELKLNCTEMSMIRWMCGVKLNERKKSEELRLGNVSHRAGGEHKYHAIKQRKNTINQYNHKLSLAWALWR